MLRKLVGRTRLPRRVIIHIGTHKTGSTAIQQFCFDNRRILHQYGVCYPEAFTQWKGHHPVAWSLGVPHPYKDPGLTKAVVVSGILEAYQESRAKTLLLSSEDFEFVGEPSIIRELFEDIPVQVVVYLRRQDDYLFSEYCHHVLMEETRYTGSLEAFVEENDLTARFDYVRLLTPWIETFGRDKIVARSYDLALAERGLIQDFLLSVGIGWDETLAARHRPSANVSLDAHTNEILRFFNNRDLASRSRRVLIRMLKQLSREGVVERPDAENRVRIVPVELRSFMSEFPDSNYRIGKLFPELVVSGGLPCKEEAFRIGTESEDCALPSTAELLARLVEWLMEREPDVMRIYRNRRITAPLRYIRDRLKRTGRSPTTR